MPRHRRTRRRSHRRRHRGGNAPNPSSYSSGATYGMAVNGTGDSQYNRVFDIQGPDGNYQSNAIVGLQGQKAGKRKSRRGGMWGHIINQAIVPATLLGLQQTYGKKRSQKNRTRKYRGGEIFKPTIQ